MNKIKTLTHEIFDFFSKFLYETYLAISLTLSSFLAFYTDIKTAALAFVIFTVLDTITRINANAKNKGLKFNPFKAYFWAEIQSGELRKMLQKVVMEYGIYLIIAFVIDALIFKHTVLFEVYDRKMTLPVIALHVFSGIELWSIGENIADAGGENIFKRIIHFLPEKYQKIFIPEAK
jgi:hypothetical protein